MSKILISGINGFIGSNLAEFLINMGHTVSGIVRKTSDLSFLSGLKVELFEGDITIPNTLSEPLKDQDIVIHAAGLASDWGPYRRFYTVNVEGTQNMARAAAAGGVKRFVHISTVALHGFHNQRHVDESFAMANTIFPYNETKKLAERWLFEFAESTAMEITAVRPGNVFGPKDHTFIEKYLKALQKGKGAYVDRGRHWTCPTYIENLTDGIAKACFNKRAAKEAFIITDGLQINWKEFTESFCAVLGIEAPHLSIPYNIAYAAAWLMESVYKIFRISRPPLLTRYRISNGGRDYHFSIKKAEQLLGYRPHVPFGQAVRRTVAWYRKR